MDLALVQLFQQFNCLENSCPPAAPPPPGFHTPLYYGQCMVGGVLACGLTHAAVVTLDVAKCRTQALSPRAAPGRTT